MTNPNCFLDPDCPDELGNHGCNLINAVFSLFSGRALSHAEAHACGYALANAGHDTRAIQDWLGHRSIQHTVRYTELAPTRFKDFWR